MPDLSKKLQGISEKWEDIGLYLDLEEEELEAMESKHGSTPLQCMKEILKVWNARKQPPLTWAAIIEILEFLELAHKLEQEALDQHKDSPGTVSMKCKAN